MKTQKWARWCIAFTIVAALYVQQHSTRHWREMTLGWVQMTRMMRRWGSYFPPSDCPRGSLSPLIIIWHLKNNYQSLTLFKFRFVQMDIQHHVSSKYWRALWYLCRLEKVFDANFGQYSSGVWRMRKVQRVRNCNPQSLLNSPHPCLPHDGQLSALQPIQSCLRVCESIENSPSTIRPIFPCDEFDRNFCKLTSAMICTSWSNRSSLYSLEPPFPQSQGRKGCQVVVAWLQSLPII